MPIALDELDGLDSEDSKAVGLRIKELRKQHLGISSQEEFGEKIGVSRGAVAGWEIGKGISRVNLYRVARLWGVSMVWLSTGRGAPMSTDESIGSEIEAMIAEHQLSDAERSRFSDELRSFVRLRLDTSYPAVGRTSAEGAARGNVGAKKTTRK